MSYYANQLREHGRNDFDEEAANEMDRLEDELAAAHLDNRTLRKALTGAMVPYVGISNKNLLLDWPRIAREALSAPTDTSAIDKLEAGYQARIKELREALKYGGLYAPKGSLAEDVIAKALSLPTDTSALDRMIAEEREACAKVCDEARENLLHLLEQFGAEKCAVAIRARGGK